MIHPKVLAAFYAALAVAVVSVGNAVTADYQGAWVPIVAALIPVVAGFLKSASSGILDDFTPSVVDPAADGHDGEVA